jgi:host factor-I protein
MKKTTREPLARNEPIRRKKSTAPSAEVQRGATKEESPSALPATEDGSVRVFRPEGPVPVNLPVDAMGHRKLIRTTMEEVRRRQAEGKLMLNESATSIPVRGQHAPDVTEAEFQYLFELVRDKTPVSVKLTNGDVVEGWIEYTDRNFIRLTREGKPNLFIYKHEIKYIEEKKREPEERAP